MFVQNPWASKCKTNTNNNNNINDVSVPLMMS